MVSIVAAVADNGAIGKDNSLLWHISEDMKFFRELTVGGTVIMGRKTYESIGRPLPRRRNIVISRQMQPVPGIEVFPSIEEAVKAAADEKCFIIGGGEVYRQAMPSAGKLYITRVHVSPDDADTFFPEISPAVWIETEHSGLRSDEASGITYEFLTYSRK